MNMTYLANIEPGGYVQWVEADHSKSKILHKKAGAPASAAKKVISICNSWFTGMLPGPLRLPDLFVENGLEVLADELWGVDRLNNETNFHSPMFIMSGGRPAMEAAVKKGEIVREDVEKLLEQAVEEVRNGDVYQHSNLLAVVGRKPL